MIEAFADVLAGLVDDVSPEDVADVLWLAARMAAGDVRVAVPDPDPLDIAEDVFTDAGAPTAAPEEPPDGEPRDASSYFAPVPSRTVSNVLSHPARIPGTRALPNAAVVARALKPFKHHEPSAWRTELDIHATVATIAETGVVDVVLRPADDRWLNLALIVDDGLSMRPWQQLARELHTLLLRLGTFRTVRLLGLDTTTPGRARLHTRPYGRSPSPLPPNAAADPSGRTVVLVLTDGIGPAWHDGSAHRRLAHWGRSGPTAVIQPLPQRLWAGTGISPQRLRARSRSRGARNSQLEVGHPLIPAALAPSMTLPVPVLETTAASLRQWARLVTGAGTTADLLITDAGAPAEGHADGVADAAVVSAETAGTGTATTGSAADGRLLLSTFRAAASPGAYRLAAHLAAVSPLTLPVMHLVQSVLPDATRTHLAEVFLGGLLRRTDEDEVYDFQPDTRPLLLDTLVPDDTFAMIAAVGDRIDAWHGDGPENRALRSEDTGLIGLPPDARPFAVSGSPLRSHLSDLGDAAAPAVEEDGGGEAEEPRMVLSPFDLDFDFGSERLVESPRPGAIDLTDYKEQVAGILREARAALAASDYSQAEVVFYRLLNLSVRQGSLGDQSLAYEGVARAAASRRFHDDAEVAFRNAIARQRAANVAAGTPVDDERTADLLMMLAETLRSPRYSQIAAIDTHAEAVRILTDLAELDFRAGEPALVAAYETLAFLIASLPEDHHYFVSGYNAMIQTADHALDVLTARNPGNADYRNLANDLAARFPEVFHQDDFAADGFIETPFTTPFSTASAFRGTSTRPTYRSTRKLPATLEVAPAGIFRVHLSWNALPTLAGPRPSRFALFAPTRPTPAPMVQSRLVDLDLGCLYETADGQRGAVQALGHRRGSYERPPYIRIDEDNLFVNLDHAEEFDRVLFFVFAYAGAFDGAHARLQFIPALDEPHEARLNRPTADALSCAVAMMTWHRRKLVIRREMKYSTGFQSDLDRLYDWGLPWDDDGARPGGPAS